ncbi:MAG TPA: hypothetical protein VKA27_13005, partial [Sunxiuqinia sp.]|nr:hypothetical protein [Sunxiuqinia sp.]
MYELEQVFQNTAFVINFIIQIILLIVFLCLAWNVSKIRKTLSKDDDSIMISDARRMVFKGDQSKAIDIYYDLLYYYRFQYNPPEKQMKID